MYLAITSRPFNNEELSAMREDGVILSLTLLATVRTLRIYEVVNNTGSVVDVSDAIERVIESNMLIAVHREDNG